MALFVPVRKKQFYQAKQFFGFIRVNINDGICIRFHVSADISNPPETVNHTPLIRRNLVL